MQNFSNRGASFLLHLIRPGTQHPRENQRLIESVLRFSTFEVHKSRHPDVLRSANPQIFRFDQRQPYNDWNGGRESWSRQKFDRNNSRQDQRYNFENQTPKAPDWSEEPLEDFPKDFYTVHENVKNRAPEDVEAYRSKHQITVKGGDIPDPVFSFEEMNFPSYINERLQTMNFQEPTVIQAQAWPIAMSGRNLVGIAQTGTGKTLAYALPGIVHIKNQKKTSNIWPPEPAALILAPTRELARQIQDVIKNFSGAARIRHTCLFGGASKLVQAMELEKCPDIVIATPGRLIDFINTKSINLKKCTYLVLDEADRMLDMGFEPQIRAIISQIRPDRQTLMWSATWPKEVRELAQDFLGTYAQVNIGSVNLSANHDIIQTLEVCEEHEKINKLVERLKEVEEVEGEAARSLVFVRTKQGAETAAAALSASGRRVAVLHGGRSQLSRDRAMQAFRTGRVRILVATDVAARGLDVDDIKDVINMDFPNTVEEYIHRIGRTGRRGATGRAHSLLTHEDARLADELAAVLQEAGQDVPKELEDMMFQQGKGKSRGGPGRSRSWSPAHGRNRPWQTNGPRSDQRDNFGPRRSKQGYRQREDYDEAYN